MTDDGSELPDSQTIVQTHVEENRRSCWCFNIEGNQYNNTHCFTGKKENQTIYVQVYCKTTRS